MYFGLHAKSVLFCAFLGANTSFAAPEPEATSEQNDKKPSKAPSKAVETISVTGSRVSGRTVADSAAPVDVFDGDVFRQQGSSDLNELLRNVVPSFSVQTQPISDGSSFIRPVTLRGLPPDEILVLVNGKRRHRAALVQLLGGSLTQGAQGPDIANIPTIALKRVEVLRDGAAAQYGSDAIAGVINFALKDANHGAEAFAQYGSTFRGDGSEYKVSANAGLPITDEGFLNISAEITRRGEVSRGTQRPDAQSYREAGIAGVPEPAMIWGAPIFESKRAFWNAGLAIVDDVDLYAFGNYSDTQTDGSFYYRNLDRDFFVDEPRVPGDPSQGTFNFRDRFPGGFTPRFEGDVKDFSQVIGLKGYLTDELRYDFSGGYGRNKIEYLIRNTINPSLGENSPTVFRPGGLVQSEKNLNADLSYRIDALRINLAGGLEFRQETYGIEEGDQASWEIGPYPHLGIGSNGFPGYDPQQTGEWSRENYSAYADAEWEADDEFLLAAAARFDAFSDFGATVNGKISARYHVVPDVTLRATASTGFRAPTPGQAHTTNVGTRFFKSDPTPVAVGIIPPTNPIATYFGAEALKPEKALNLTLGMGWELAKNLTVTVDLYQIEVSDRIALSGNIPVTENDRAELAALGIERASDFGRIQFFTNTFGTRTRGLDFVTNYSLRWFGGHSVFNLAYNYNRTTVRNVQDTTIIDEARRTEIEEMLPAHRVNLRVTHTIADWGMVVNTAFFSPWTEAVNNSQTYGSEVVTDLETWYYVTDSLMIAAGMSNVFDEYPDQDQSGTAFGRVYPEYSPIGVFGRSGYMKASYTF